MEQAFLALSDRTRWRILELLALRPRSVGEIAELTGVRQPQATKHLQTLARSGFVTAFPLGQRRVYAIESASLALIHHQLGALIETSHAHSGERNVVARYRAAIDAASAAANRKGWADGRSFAFERVLPAPIDVVWRHWIEPKLLASWWTPPSMTVVECGLEPKAGGRAVLEYRDAEGRYRSEGRVHAARERENLVFDLSVVNESGVITFTGHYELSLLDVDAGTRLRLGLRISETTVEAVPFIAGIETGWGQVLDNLSEAVGTFRGTTNPVQSNNKGKKA